MDKIIQQFLNYLKTEKGRTDQTLDNYRFYLNRFFISSKISQPQQINEQTTTQYKHWLEQQTNEFGKNLCQATQNYHLTALRSFIRYLNKKNIITLAAQKVILGKLPKKSFNYLDITELPKLLDAPLKTQEARAVQLRDKAMMELLFCAGLKVSEISKLKKTDINLNRNEFLVASKFNKPRAAILSNQAQFAIKNYLTFRRDLSPFLFVRHDKANPTNKPPHITPRSIQRLIKRYAKLAGLKKNITPQTLRTTFAAQMFNQGSETESVQNLLGHSSINTTKLYENQI
ncbi:MAG: tyrosine-type recombinase/integrase [Candidatus Buchananbacteria bacterium]